VEVLEPANAGERLLYDQERPAVAQDSQRPGDGARLVRQFVEAHLLIVAG
jgi:hypothetical protein